MKYYLIAGEASGDLHASGLMTELKRNDTQAEFRFFGGERMQSAGGTLVRHYREMAYMGIIPVLLHLPAILRNMRECRKDVRTYNPDVVILVDYPGFNLKMARYIRTQLKIPVCYYISPKLWAWKQYRIRSFRRYVDRMFCILPFEEEYFRSLNYAVDYVGNPSVDSVSAYRASATTRPDTFRRDNSLTDAPLIAILAGSRKAEIRQNLPAMLTAASRITGYQTVIAGAPGLTPEDYHRALAYCTSAAGIRIVYGQTYDLLAQASVALVTSGTATLETALFRVPQVVCYYIGGGRLIHTILGRIVHVTYISLVNLIAGREVVKELYGAHFSARSIGEELQLITQDSTRRNEILKGYDDVIARLGNPGAAQRTAALITGYLTPS
jgi:lipid-A-disaccharide synthase